MGTDLVILSEARDLLGTEKKIPRSAQDDNGPDQDDSGAPQPYYSGANHLTATTYMAQLPAQSDDQLVELTQRARAISQEAGTKVTSAMRDMISAAAGIAGFAVESARDLVQYMVRRGQMTQEEADRLMREAEAVHNKKPKAERDRIAAARAAADKAVAEKKAARLAAEHALPTNKPLSKTVKTAPLKPLIPAELESEERPSMKAEKAPAKVEKPARAAAPAKSTARAAAPAKAKTVAKAPAKKPAAKAPAKKAAAKKKK